jgi:universal stress protein A
MQTQKIERILVPVDFSDCSRSAMEFAVYLANAFNAQIDVLHVWRPPELAGEEVQVFNRGMQGTSLKSYMEEQANIALAAFLKEASKEPRVNPKPRLESGDPAETICKIAGDGKYNLIVMGTHGRTGLSLVFLGSVAEKVVRMAPCPVTTYRVPDKS